MEPFLQIPSWMIKQQHWYIGCSGFHYREWKGVFYPDKLPKRSWFEYYSSQFDTLELNVTFYRFPQVSFLENWYNISPPDFRFAVKAPRAITHFKQFKECEDLLNSFYGTVEAGLREKVQAILFQMPPKFSYTPERLEILIQNTRPGFNNVFEFRHVSWWNAEVYKILHASGVSFSGQSHPQLPAEAIVNNEQVYYRFHGVPRLYYSIYDQKTLKSVADVILANPTAKNVCVYFNNTAGTGAVENALWLRDYVNLGIAGS